MVAGGRASAGGARPIPRLDVAARTVRVRRDVHAGARRATIAAMTILSSDAYRALAEQAPVLIWRCDARGARDYFNERWSAFTGRVRTQDLGDGWVEALHGEDVQACLATYRAALAAGRPCELEYRLRHRDGAYRWVLERAVPLRDAEGRLAGLVGSCLDVTERVLAEREAERRSALRVRRLHALLPVCPGCDHLRDEPAYWREVTAYVEANAAVAFSDALCPACRARLQPGAGSGG